MCLCGYDRSLLGLAAQGLSMFGARQARSDHAIIRIVDVIVVQLTEDRHVNHVQAGGPPWCARVQSESRYFQFHCRSVVVRRRQRLGDQSSAPRHATAASRPRSFVLLPAAPGHPQSSAESDACRGRGVERGGRAACHPGHGRAVSRDRRAPVPA